MDELQSGGRSRIAEPPLSASEPNMAPVLSEPAHACYLAVGRLIRGELSPPPDQIDTHAVLATGRIGHTCLICDVDVVHTCDCAMNELLCTEATPRGFHPTRIEQLN